MSDDRLIIEALRTDSRAGGTCTGAEPHRRPSSVLRLRDWFWWRMPSSPRRLVSRLWGRSLLGSGLGSGLGTGLGTRLVRSATDCVCPAAGGSTDLYSAPDD